MEAAGAEAGFRPTGAESVLRASHLHSEIWCRGLGASTLMSEALVCVD